MKIEIFNTTIKVERTTDVGGIKEYNNVVGTDIEAYIYPPTNYDDYIAVGEDMSEGMKITRLLVNFLDVQEGDYVTDLSKNKKYMVNKVDERDASVDDSTHLEIILRSIKD